MKQFKTIVTITWKFDSDQNEQECLAFAKQQLEQILDTQPHGKDFDDFCVQVDLAKMKDRKKLIHIASYELDDVFPYITIEDVKRDYKVGDTVYSVRMNSDRFHVFKNNNQCVVCGLYGTKMILDLNPGDSSPHFNLYGEEHGRFVLMTKDHIIAKSKGGSNEQSNYQTMCAICNNLKADCDLSKEQILEIRKIHDNEAKLPHKELRDLINNKREEMSR